MLRCFFAFLFVAPLLLAPAAAQTGEGRDRWRDDFAPRLLPISAGADSAGADSAEAEAGAEELFEIFHGVFLSQGGRHGEAAERLAVAGRKLQSAAVMQAATEAAVRGKDFSRAERFAKDWLRFGGGILAQQAAAEALIINGKLGEAAGHLADLVHNQGQPASQLYEQLAVSPQPAAALSAGRQLFPQDADGLYHLARLALHFENVRAARQHFNAALRLDNTSPEFVFFNGYLAAFEVGAAVAALPILEEYAAAGCGDEGGGGKFPDCNLSALLAAYAGFIANGASGDWQVGGLETPRVRHLTAGGIYESWDMPERAAREYEQLPDDFAARSRRARLAEEGGDLAAALRIWRETAVTTDAAFAGREAAIAELLEKTEGLDAGIAYLQKTGAGNYSLLYLLSLMQESAGRAAEAVETLRGITELFPDEADGWNALGYVMADNNIAVAEAKEYILRAMEMRPDDANFIDSLGWAEYRLGNLAVAEALLRVAAAASDAAEIAAHLGEVLWERGARAEARAVWRRALAREPDNETLNETLQRYAPF